MWEVEHVNKYTVKLASKSSDSFLMSALAGGIGCLAIIILIYGLIFVVCMLLGLVAHFVFPQWGYWQETALIFLVAALGSMIFGGKGSSNA